MLPTMGGPPQGTRGRADVTTTALPLPLPLLYPAAPAPAPDEGALAVTPALAVDALTPELECGPKNSEARELLCTSDFAWPTLPLLDPVLPLA